MNFKWKQAEPKGQSSTSSKRLLNPLKSSCQQLEFFVAVFIFSGFFGLSPFSLGHSGIG